MSLAATDAFQHCLAIDPTVQDATEHLYETSKVIRG